MIFSVFRFLHSNFYGTQISLCDIIVYPVVQPVFLQFFFFSLLSGGVWYECKCLHPVFVHRSAKMWMTTEEQNVPATFQPSRTSSRCSRSWCSSSTSSVYLVFPLKVGIKDISCDVFIRSITVCEHCVSSCPIYPWTLHFVLSNSIFTHSSLLCIVLKVSCPQSTSCCVWLICLPLLLLGWDC